MNTHRVYTRKESLNLTISKLVHKLANQYGDKEALVFRDEFRTYRYTYAEIYNYTKKTTNYLLNKGLHKGDKVIIWSYNSPEWIIVFFACILSGIIPVPLDFNSSKDFIQKVIRETEAKLLFSSRYKRFSKEDIIIEDIKDISKAYPSQIPKTRITTNDTLEILYTSGTTSDPKGVVLTHKNIISNIHSVRRIIGPINRGSYLSIIPLSHILEQTIGLFAPFLFGYKITYISSRKSTLIEEAIVNEKVNVIVTVPAFLKVIKQKIEAKVKETGTEEIFNWVLTLPKALKISILKRRIPIIKDLRYLLVGGAALDSTTELFWNKLGITVLQGYGLTETAPIISSNSLKESKIGTVGKVLPLQKVRIAKDKEIQFKGINIFSQYYKNKKDTVNSFTKDGWYKTGDLGEIDTEGFLKIIGRKKNMILSDSGLNIYPEDIEKVIDEHKAIKESVVLGIRQNNSTKITAVVILKDNYTYSDSLKDSINKNLNSSQQIQKVLIWPKDDFPRTPSLKIKRRNIEEYINKLAEKSKREINNSSYSVPNYYNIISRVIGRSTSEINPNDLLYSDLNIDSIKRVELVSALEETIGIELNESDISDKTKVKDLDTIINLGRKRKVRSYSLWSFSKVLYPVRIISQSTLFLVTKLFYQLEVHGINNVERRNEPLIFVMNHTSHLDTLALLQALPANQRYKTATASAQDYFFKERQSILERIFQVSLQLVINIFPFSRFDQVKKSFKRVGKILDLGYNILIFPEGTRSLTGELGEFLQGTGLIATQMNAKIIPVKVEGLFEILPKGSRYPKHRGKAKITFGELYSPDKNKAVAEITKEIRDIIKKL